MKTSLVHRSQSLVWLRLGLVALVLMGVITVLLMTNSQPVEAAKEITLRSNDILLATGDGCSLLVLNSSETRARLGCEAFTSTPTETATATATATETATPTLTPTEEVPILGSVDDQSGMFKFTSDVVSAPDAKVRVTIKPGKKLVVLPTSGACKLKLLEQTAALVRIKCKPLPITATPTRTRTPTKTRGPAMTNLWVGNYTTATLCFEVYGSGIGAKCWIEYTPKEIGSFPAGVYSYKAQAWCGSLTDTVNFPPGKVTLNFGCSSGILSKVSENSPELSAPDAFSTPAR